MNTGIWGVSQGRLKGTKEEALRPGWRLRESLVADWALVLGADIRAGGRDKAQRCLEEGSRELAVDRGGPVLELSSRVAEPGEGEAGTQAHTLGWVGRAIAHLLLCPQVWDAIRGQGPEDNSGREVPRRHRE